MKRRVTLFFLVAAMATVAANAEPITYTGFTIADGKIGTWEFHNARVYLKFESDTKNVQLLQLSVPGFDTPAAVAYNATGVARITIFADGKRVHATFAPNQIFVSADLGDAPGGSPRGIGFGSLWPSGPNPTYPLGIQDGMIDAGDAIENGGPASALSDELAAQSPDLMHPTTFSGRAWICTDFLSPRDCPIPTDPLKTDRGDLFLYQKYIGGSVDDALTGGTFSAVTRGSGRPQD